MADRLKTLRLERGWSLEALCERCGVSRATLSRLENAEVSPTAQVLGKLCSAFGLTMSRLMAMVETGFVPLVPCESQQTWQDPKNGFLRKNISPPSQALAAEMVECRLAADEAIDYPHPPDHDIEHHLYMLEGCLKLTIHGEDFLLNEGDCLRYRLRGASRFSTGKEQAARYLLVIV
ncbi:helix-turn-helix domain-containing protein [Hoeflea poritis]|uniref:XRE family transcriptional regulator n=1 Tax=Hoeflea poritis TaxID=2993659 RepID=A0ABT4VVA6_9HYPH|nr:XRE family transcriptional regulator [Hoeflea poritis]MDA4848657.1 XRE family transcriptional regulator [Hoeflea poritis]